ncbi:hypothetical protein ACU045_01620 [Microbacterium sp. MAHUQ-60]|uniref:hypothetical protein n=1 Tax=unclassified Microbacterium TaxID=2609290 RepID=UPI0036166C48
MTVAIRVVGDDLPSLVPLMREMHGSDRPRCVVIAVDLRGAASRRDAKRRMHQALEDAMEGVNAAPAVRHVLLAIARGDQARTWVDATASSILTRTHAAVQLRMARDIEFTSLDISECTNPELLADRIVERGESMSQTHGVVVLDWADISSQSIAAAAREIFS